MKANSIKLPNRFSIFAAVLASVWLTAMQASAAFTVLAGWDISGQTGGGTTSLAPATPVAGVTISNLIRGSGIGQGTATTSFGGNHWTNVDESTAIASNAFIVCSISPATNYTLSFNAVDKLNYNRSSTGPPNGVFQYSLDGVNFTDVSPSFSWSVTSGNGLTVNVDLSGISALQNVGYGTNVTFRIVNWGASGATGTWYIKDAATAGNDYEFLGTITQAASGIPPGNVIVTPANISTNANATVTFTVSATGDQPNYFWYQIAGGTTNLVSTDGPAFTLANVSSANSGNYQVVLTNASGAATSSIVTLTVNDPAIIVQPANITNILNDVDFFSAAAVSSQPMDFYWYYHGTVISNLSVSTIATNTIFVVNTTAATNLPGYYLVASNQLGAVTSVVATATIFVTPSVEITRWDFNAPDTYTATNPSASIGMGLATPGPNPGVTNFIFAPGALFDPNQLVAGSVNDAIELNGFPAGITNKTAGFQYNTSTAGYKNILLTWSERHSATASKYMRVQYSTNGVDFMDGDVETFSAVAYQFYSSNLGTNPGVANNTNFAFRVVAEWESSAIGTVNSNYDGTTGAFGSGGTIREDLMTMFGDLLSLVTPIPLHIQPAGKNVVLTWNDPSSAFSLQSAPLVNGTYTNVTSATSPYTNAITGAQQFFRLKSN